MSCVVLCEQITHHTVLDLPSSSSSLQLLSDFYQDYTLDKMGPGGWGGSTHRPPGTMSTYDLWPERCTNLTQVFCWISLMPALMSPCMSLSAGRRSGSLRLAAAGRVNVQSKEQTKRKLLSFTVFFAQCVRDLHVFALLGPVAAGRRCIAFPCVPVGGNLDISFQQEHFRFCG